MQYASAHPSVSCSSNMYVPSLHLTVFMVIVLSHSLFGPLRHNQSGVSTLSTVGSSPNSRRNSTTLQIIDFVYK